MGLKKNVQNNCLKFSSSDSVSVVMKIVVHDVEGFA